MEIEIICKETIKPATPTPLHLKQFNISIIDQLTTRAYIPLLLFYPNNHQNTDDQNIIILERNNLLRKSLSRTLVSFYPLAGVINNDNSLNVDCNDNGVNYVETRIKNQQLPDFLKNMEAKFMRQLFPYDPDLVQFSGKTFVVAIQANIFACGGLALGVISTHKILDAYSMATFLKSWGEHARGCCNETIISPSFDASFIFPQNPTLSKDASIIVRPLSLQPPKCVARMFFFHSSALSELKTKASIKMNASRVVSVVGLIWKSLISASKKRNGFQKPSVLSIPVNLRSRISPPLQDFSMGNIVWFATARFGPEKDPELGSIVTCLQDSISQIDATFIEGLKGSEGSIKMADRLRKLQEEVYSDEDAEYYCFSSWRNSGFPDIDFGFGKPSRTVLGCPDSDNPGLSNTIILNDFESGNGIEVFVSVCEDDMKIIEQDQEMLRFASTSI